MSATDWATIASLATAAGTLVLAVATFAAVRSANTAARVAERALLAGLRPVLAPTRREDPAQKVSFGDLKWLRIPSGGAAAEVGGGDGTMGPADDVVYLAIGLRNVGTGMGVLHGWQFHPRWHRSSQQPQLADFRRQDRDLYVPPGDTGFWQAAFRDTADPQYQAAREVIESGAIWTVELLYGDTEGGQRMITRFQMFPVEEEQDAGRRGRWVAVVSRYWNVDRPQPR